MNVKKVVSLVLVVIVMAFCGAMAGCSNIKDIEAENARIQSEIEDLENSLSEEKQAHELSKSKIEAITEISGGVTQLMADNFYDFFQSQKLLEVEKIWIEKVGLSTSESEIDEYLTTAKSEMGAVETKEVTGVSYSLQEAYDNGYLSKSDLQAMYIINTTDIGIAPLEKKYEKAILSEYAEQKGLDYAVIEEWIEIGYYLGMYHGYAVVVITHYAEGYPDDPQIETVGGFTFTHTNASEHISVWKIV